MTKIDHKKQTNKKSNKLNKKIFLGLMKHDNLVDSKESYAEWYKTLNFGKLDFHFITIEVKIIIAQIVSFYHHTDSTIIYSLDSIFLSSH